MGTGEPESGVYNERTALAWQRTALALLAGAAVVSRLALDRLGALAAVSVVVALPVTGWVLWASSRRYQAHHGAHHRAHHRAGQGPRGRGGRAPAALVVVTVVIALTELAALLVEAR